MHKTTNGGESWQVISSVSHDFVEDIFFQDESKGWFAARNQSGGAPGEDGKGFIYKTTDRGSTWNLEWFGPWPMSSLSQITMQPGGTLWACGCHSTILKGPNAIDIRESTKLPNSDFKLFSLPNPFCHNTILSYSVPDKKPVSLKIYDIKGEVVKSTYANNQKPTTNNYLVWNGTDDSGRELPLGIYILRLTSNKITTQTKTIKFK